MSFTTPPPQQPCPMSCVPPELAMHMENISRDNERMYQLLSQRANADQAYTQIYENWDKSLFVKTRSGTHVRFLDHTIDHAYHVKPQPPFLGDELYVIYLDGVDTPINLSAEKYQNDRALLTVLQETPGVTVTLVNRSLRITMNLLRSAFSARMEIIEPRFYGGWRSTNDQEIHFWIFPYGETHQTQELYEEESRLPQTTQAAAAIAAQQFWRVFKAIRTPSIRFQVFIWLHTAALHTLLPLIGDGAVLSLCLFSGDTDVLAYLEWLLNWYGDTPISLGQPSAAFALELLSRKDQPLVVKDYGRLRSMEQNAGILEDALASRQIPWKYDKHGRTFPLQAPITILTNQVSALSCAPAVVTADVTAEDFDRQEWYRLVLQDIDYYDYLAAFTSFTESHIRELRTALLEGKRDAMVMSAGTLSRDCSRMLGIFLGIARFLQDFFRFCLPSVPPVDISDERVSELHQLLRRTSERGENISLPDTFAGIVRKQIQHGTLAVASRIAYCPEKEDVVFFDEDTLYFTAPAFRTVCQAVHQSQTTVLRALADAGVLRGTPTNSTTYQTRITVPFKPGVHEVVSVYAIDRKAIEDIGDPLPLNEEESDDN